MVTIEDLVPKEHLVRDLENAIDFSFIYNLVEELYCQDNGRSSIEPLFCSKCCLFNIYLESKVLDNMANVAIKGKWQVIFSENGTGKDIADINVLEEDFKVIE